MFLHPSESAVPSFVFLRNIYIYIYLIYTNIGIYKYIAWLQHKTLLFIHANHTVNMNQMLYLKSRIHHSQIVLETIKIKNAKIRNITVKHDKHTITVEANSMFDGSNRLRFCSTSSWGERPITCCDDRHETHINP